MLQLFVCAAGTWQRLGTRVSMPEAPWSRGSRSNGYSPCYPLLVQQTLSAPSFHILEAKCNFPISPPSPYSPPWNHLNAGERGGTPPPVSVLGTQGCARWSRWHQAQRSPRLNARPARASLSGRGIWISSCQVFLSKQLGVWAAACSLKASEIFQAALLVPILLEQK